MIGELTTIYKKVLDEGWTPHAKSIFKHKAVYLINLYSPDETDVRSVWLISNTYKARDIDYSITQRAWDHDGY